MSVHRSVLVCVSESVSVDGWACEHTGPVGVGCGGRRELPEVCNRAHSYNREREVWLEPSTCDNRAERVARPGGSVHLSNAECTQFGNFFSNYSLFLRLASSKVELVGHS